MNILFIGDTLISNIWTKLCQNSKSSCNIYTTANVKGASQILSQSFEELIDLARKNQIDIIVILDKKYVSAGFVELLKKERLNVISAGKKWLNLETNRVAAKKLAEYYSIKTPNILKIPSVFPVVIKSSEPFEGETERFAYSMNELIEKKMELTCNNAKQVFIEEYIEGDEFSAFSIWDGRSFLHFPLKDLTEVQEERLNLYRTKMNFMFSDEKADFIGFVSSKLLWAKNDWYLLEYKIIPDTNISEQILSTAQVDLPYIFNLALFQKLGEYTL